MPTPLTSIVFSMAVYVKLFLLFITQVLETEQHCDIPCTCIVSREVTNS